MKSKKMFTFLVAVDLMEIAHLLDARGRQEKLTNNDINEHACVCVCEREDAC